MVVQDWKRTVYQIEDPDPYPLTNGGHARHARGPVHHSSVTFILLAKVKWLVDVNTG